MAKAEEIVEAFENLFEEQQFLFVDNSELWRLKKSPGFLEPGRYWRKIQGKQLRLYYKGEVGQWHGMIVRQRS